MLRIYFNEFAFWGITLVLISLSSVFLIRKVQFKFFFIKENAISLYWTQLRISSKAYVSSRKLIRILVYPHISLHMMCTQLLETCAAEKYETLPIDEQQTTRRHGKKPVKWLYAVILFCFDAYKLNASRKIDIKTSQRMQVSAIIPPLTSISSVRVLLWEWDGNLQPPPPQRDGFRPWRITPSVVNVWERNLDSAGNVSVCQFFWHLT
jgi:hypothetical protein